MSKKELSPEKINPQAVFRALRKPDQVSPSTSKEWTLAPAGMEMTDRAHRFGSYSAFRAAGWTDEQLISEGYMRRRSKPDDAGLYQHAVDLAALARKMGFVITIEQVSDYPPAMGKHHDVVTVREVRK